MRSRFGANSQGARRSWQYTPFSIGDCGTRTDTCSVWSSISSTSTRHHTPQGSAHARYAPATTCASSCGSRSRCIWMLSSKRVCCRTLLHASANAYATIGASTEALRLKVRRKLGAYGAFKCLQSRRSEPCLVLTEQRNGLPAES